MLQVQLKKLNDQATLWVVTPDGFGGDTFATPVLLDCRWEDRSVVFSSPIDRREHVSNSVVFTESDVALGDYLAQGDLTANATPLLLEASFKVQRFDKFDDLRGRATLRRALL